MSSLFEVDPVTNEIVYKQEEESITDGNNVDQTHDQGSVLQPEALDPAQVQENQMVVLDPDNLADSGIMLLSQDDIAVLALNAPATGSLNSSTIDYFDRIVNGLPAEYVYVAYRWSVDDAYAGTIVFGDDYVLNDDTIVFGDNTTQIDVERHSGQGMSTYISYDKKDASNAVVQVDQNGNILYYTNAFDGYPILGSGSKEFEIAPFIVVGLMAAIASVVLNKLLNRRRKHD